MNSPFLDFTSLCEKWLVHSSDYYYYVKYPKNYHSFWYLLAFLLAVLTAAYLLVFYNYYNCHSIFLIFTLESILILSGFISLCKFVTQRKLFVDTKNREIVIKKNLFFIKKERKIKFEDIDGFHVGCLNVITSNISINWQFLIIKLSNHYIAASTTPSKSLNELSFILNNLIKDDRYV